MQGSDLIRGAPGRIVMRRGFTIIELMVVMSVLAILIALILPAIIAVRERGRRTQCLSHVRDFGTAINAFEAAFHLFPPAQPLTTASPIRMSSQFYAPHVLLLPYFEQSSVAAQIDTSRSQFYFWNPAVIDPVARTRIASFQCPSDPVDGGNSYRFCVGTGPSALQSPLSPGGNGPFEALRSHTAGDIRDGLSNTVAVSEKLQGSGSLAQFSPEDYWYTGITNVLGIVPPLDEMVSLCGSLNGQPSQFQPYTGGTWYISAYDYTWYNHGVCPNAKIFDWSAQSFSPTAQPGDGVYKASSRHSGGVNCVFMDGHTRFISDSVDIAVWRALSTRAGGEPISDASF